MADKAIALVDSHPFLIDAMRRRDEAAENYAERKKFIELHMKNYEEDLQRDKKAWWKEIEEWIAQQPFAPPGFKPGTMSMSLKNGALILHDKDNCSDCGTDHSDLMSIIRGLLK